MTSSAASPDPRARQVHIEHEELVVELVDGRRVSVPLTWFPRLLHASPLQRQKWELLGDGEGIHWIEIDEDLSIVGLLRGTPAPGAATTAQRDV